MTIKLKFFRSRLALSALLIVTLGVIAWIVFVFQVQPSHDRNWELSQEKLPHFTIEGDRLDVTQFRNFQWTGEATAEPRYETRRYDLRTLRTLDVFISHFDEFEGLAHIFLSFGFADGEQLVVSLESRREVGEIFSPFQGLFRQYEIIYVVGSEQDIVGARTRYRGERVYRYPTVADAAQTRALLVALADDINAVAATPRFYNTLFHNCTNELTRRVEDISTVKFPLTWKTLLPGYFDEVLYDMGLIPSSGDFPETKATYAIDNTLVDPTSDGYSQALRTLIPR
ncbi:MAG: DUF4105 domain-containing protein [Candidatus Moraniibacteriota bacterium]